VSLQRIRRAGETLRHLGSREHLSRYRLIADGGSVIWVTDDQATAQPTGGVDLVLRPGQEVLVQLKDVLSPFTNATGIDVPDFSHPRPLLLVDADLRCCRSAWGFLPGDARVAPSDQVSVSTQDGVRGDDQLQLL
jgi:hypothetical protein